MKVWVNRIEMEWYRCPVRLELFRHVVPLVVFIFVVAIGLGYAWAMAAFGSFTR